jgi:hypothetical protein
MVAAAFHAAAAKRRLLNRVSVKPMPPGASQRRWGEKSTIFLSDKPEGVNGIGKEGDIGTHLDSGRVDAVTPLLQAGRIQPFGERQSVKPCDHNIKQTIRLAERMIALADRGDGGREDIGCGILYGMLRDSGYKIKQLAEDEKRKHIAKGWWDEHC